MALPDQTGGGGGTTAVPGLCRDCYGRELTRAAAGRPARCRSCGSRRVVAHAELDTLAIAHLDCDAFYATIEKRDRPELADKPVIVGGGRRGVVSTACYIARISGVRSAMPMFQALALCPGAVVIKPDMAKYAAVAAEVRARMQALTPLVEPISIDEAFLDLGGTAMLHGTPPAVTLARLAGRIERELGITVSIGLAPNKLLAKIASDLDKPRGFSVLGQAEAAEFLAGRPIGILPGIGGKTSAALAAHGIHTVGEFARLDLGEAMRLTGSSAVRMLRHARGIDDRPVSPDGERKSVSAETTFDVDVEDRHELSATLRRLAEKVSRRMKAGEIAGQTVTLKLKTPDFRLATRSRRLPAPTRLADRIHEVALDLLTREPAGRRYRLIGVGLSELGPAKEADPEDLLDRRRTKRAQAELAMDAIRDRFGGDAIELGLTRGGRRPPDGGRR